VVWPYALSGLTGFTVSAVSWRQLGHCSCLWGWWVRLGFPAGTKHCSSELQFSFRACKPRRAFLRHVCLERMAGVVWVHCSIIWSDWSADGLGRLPGFLWGLRNLLLIPAPLCRNSHVSRGSSALCYFCHNLQYPLEQWNERPQATMSRTYNSENWSWKKWSEKCKQSKVSRTLPGSLKNQQAWAS